MLPQARRLMATARLYECIEYQFSLARCSRLLGLSGHLAKDNGKIRSERTTFFQRHRVEGCCGGAYVQSPSRQDQTRNWELARLISRTASDPESFFLFVARDRSSLHGRPTNAPPFRQSSRQLPKWRNRMSSTRHAGSAHAAQTNQLRACRNSLTCENAR